MTSPRRLEFTRQAFRMLKGLQRPRILDLGCGYGEPTIELARLGAGEVFGVDIDQQALDELAAKVERAGLSSCVRVLNQSLYPDMHTMNERLECVIEHGYELVGHIPLPDDFWWQHYYVPLEERLERLEHDFGGASEVQDFVEQRRCEGSLLRKYPGWLGSAFFVMRGC